MQTEQEQLINFNKLAADTLTNKQTHTHTYTGTCTQTHNAKTHSSQDFAVA